MTDFIRPYDGLQDEKFRRAIYSGMVYRLPSSDASLRLVDHAWRRIVELLGNEPRQAQFHYDGDQFFRLAGQLRRELYLSTVVRGCIADLLHVVGANPSQHVCDPGRLRVVMVGGHQLEAAAPVYYAHRDTWYSNPQEQITWWLPLHRVELRETFEFLPDCFQRTVENDSQGFDYDRWTSRGAELKIGWQDSNAGKRELYPRLRDSLPNERRVAFAADPGEVIVFSGQHLHQTIPIDCGLTRFSLDFRTVHLGDRKAQFGPPNVDNRSTGDALDGHIPVDAAGTSV